MNPRSVGRKTRRAHHLVNCFRHPRAGFEPRRESVIVRGVSGRRCRFTRFIIFALSPGVVTREVSRGIWLAVTMGGFAVLWVFGEHSVYLT